VTDPQRYAAQQALEQIGNEGQKRLLASRVAVVGCGATGTAILDRLARAGVGTVRLIDRDIVELANLQRQFLYDERDLEQPKAIVAARKLQAINHTIEIQPIDADLNSRTCEQFLGGTNLILDGTDNLPTRWLINDFSVATGIPWIFGGVDTTGGATSSLLGCGGPCLRCIEGLLRRWDTGGSCLTAGVLNTVTSIIGSLEATEALRYLVQGAATSDEARLTLVDPWNGYFRILSFERYSKCPCCVQKDFSYLAGRWDVPVHPLCGGNSFVIIPKVPIDPAVLSQLAPRLEALGKVAYNEFLLRFTHDEFSVFVFRMGQILVKGVADEKRAKAIVSEYFGSAVSV